jgi:hypothetical protein
MFAPGPRGRARARGRDGACGDPMFYYLAWRSLEAIARCWRATRDAFGFEPVGAAATLGVVFGERVARRAPGAIGDAARVVSSAAMCARGRGRGGAAERLRDAALATCSHESDFAVACFAGSMFAKMAETERRVREAVGTRASAPATVAFALALGMATNAAAAASARARIRRRVLARRGGARVRAEDVSGEDRLRERISRTGELFWIHRRAGGDGERGGDCHFGVDGFVADGVESVRRGRRRGIHGGLV